MTSKCPFADNWENQEGWFLIRDKYVCGDWDDFCTLCMKHDGTDDIGIIVLYLKNQMWKHEN